MKTQLSGIYNYRNIMTAIAIGRYFKVPEDKMVEAIENYQPRNNRSQVLKHQSNTFLLDAYNANPTSMEYALESFLQRKEANKWAILGDMLELGVHSEEEHRQIMEKAKDRLGSHLVLVGEHFAKVAAGQDIPTFLDVAALKSWFVKQHFENTVFLLKGSRKIGLEKLVEG